MKKSSSARWISEYGLLVALAMILSYVEFLLPLLPSLPGVKLGLANIVVVFALYALGSRPAIIISLTRVFLVGLLFGNAFSLLYSLAGAVLSLAGMLILKKSSRFSMPAVAAVGGVLHNLGQLLCAVLIFDTVMLAYYLPVLIVSGTVTGLITGSVAGLLIRRITAQHGGEEGK